MIRWTRPDCYGENAFIDGGSLKLLLGSPDGQSRENADINKQSTGMDALVFQVTVEPQVPLKSIESEDSSKPDKVPDSQISRKRTKAELKEIYRSWLSQTIDCTIGANGGGWCTIFNEEKGFGYHESKAGVTALYYFPNAEEIKAWNQYHKPCSQ